ncbi:hypothetical protein XENOCAPTIV_029379 [Xenoophorus captivus]|uniref:Uncharacterized protein n=1 Tax=Xenoophorus captivus TaxID=1517983 RepID=A0ABV0RJ59_9TELE
MVAFSPDDSNAKPKVAEGKKPRDSDTSAEERRESTDEDDEEEDMISSALLEAATLPWPGGKDKKVLLDQEDDGLEEKDAMISQGGSQDLSQEGSQPEGDVRSKAKWRESMPEGDRWRDDEIELQKDDNGDGSLADDKDEKEEEDKKWIHSLDFTPRVTIVCPTTKELSEENQYREKEVERELQREYDTDPQLYPGWEDLDDKYCVVVQGIARLRFSANKPLFQSYLVNKEVLVHWHYVNESLSLFLFYFLQLAVMATYISQDLVKLVPLLTIIFVFGRNKFLLASVLISSPVFVTMEVLRVHLAHLLCCLQAHLLALPRSGQLHQRLRLRLLLLPHAGNAGRQPLLRVLVGRTGLNLRRGAARDRSSAQTAMVVLKEAPSKTW